MKTFTSERELRQYFAKIAARRKRVEQAFLATETVNVLSSAVVIGSDGKNLHFNSIRLKPQPEVVSRYMRPAASQGELRSHGFFYKPSGDDSGTLGLPISRPGRPGYLYLFESSAAILFLRNEAFQFRVVGELGAESDKAVDDHCRASCVDWYGTPGHYSCAIECLHCSDMNWWKGNWPRAR